MNATRITHTNIWKIAGPIVLSACSLFITYHLLQPLAAACDPTFHLLASKNVGKFAFTTVIILHLLFFLLTRPQAQLKKFLTTCFYFFRKTGWFKTFATIWTLFFSLHWLTLGAFVALGVLHYTPLAQPVTLSIIGSILFGFGVTFLLAWTEEMMFRGLLYQHFSLYLSPIASVLITSFCFMIVHDVTAPLNLLTTDWRIGMGLFSLGVMLNVIFVATGKLYAGMAAHAGLVSVKVVLRRLPFLSFLDLRQSTIVHCLFLLVALAILLWHKDKFAEK